MFVYHGEITTELTSVQLNFIIFYIQSGDVIGHQAEGFSVLLKKCCGCGVVLLLHYDLCVYSLTINCK